MHSRSGAAGELLRRASQVMSIMLLLSSVAPSIVAAAEAQDRLQFEIPPGPTQQALLAFWDQSRISVQFSKPEVQGSYSSGLDGWLEPRGAMTRLLEGTSLCATWTSSGQSVTVTRCPKPTEPTSDGAAESAGRRASVATPTQPTPPSTVVVPGSYIHGTAPPTPNVRVISRSDLLDMGIGTTAELVAALPELGGTPLTARAEGNSGLGIAVNLRGQGPTGSLILVNGHRLPNSGSLGAFQDLSVVPFAAVERVEIVLGGVTAQFGADAVGGVVNIVTLSEPQSPQLSLHLDEGVGTRFQQVEVNQIASRDLGSGLALETLEYNRASPWRGRDLTFPQDVVNQVPGKDHVGMYARVREDLPHEMQFTTEAFYTHRHSTEQYDLALAPVLPNSRLKQMAGVSVQMTYVASELQTAVGTDGVLSLGVDRATETQRQWSWPAGSVELADGTTEPVSAVGIIPTWFTSYARTDQLDAKLDKAIVTLPSGDLRALIGGERRWQTQQNSDSGSTPGAAQRYRRTATARFAELHIPLLGKDWSLPGLRSLELAAAGRRESYSDFEGHFMPQYWLRWSPLSGLELFASAGRAFQAPVLPDLDATRNAIVLGQAADSQSPSGQNTVLIESGNNPNLIGATATNEDLGVRFNWSLSNTSYFNTEASIFRIHFYDRVERIDFSQVQLADPSYASIITRDLTSSELATLCGSSQFHGILSDCLTKPIALVDITLKNFDSLSTEGADIHSKWRTSFTGGYVELDFRGAYYLKYREKITPQAPEVSLLRTQDSPAPLQLFSRLSLAQGHAEFALLVHYLSGFTDQSTTPIRSVSAWAPLDLQVQYSTPPYTGGMLEGIVISVMVRNVFDQSLPVLSDVAINQSYDLLSGFAVKRMMSIRVQKRF